MDERVGHVTNTDFEVNDLLFHLLEHLMPKEFWLGAVNELTERVRREVEGFPRYPVPKFPTSMQEQE